MPGVDGFELLRQVQAARPQLPTILITGYPDRLKRLPPLDEAIPAPFTKPFQGPELLEAVGAYMSSQLKAFSVLPLRKLVRMGSPCQTGARGIACALDFRQWTPSDGGKRSRRAGATVAPRTAGPSEYPTKHRSAPDGTYPRACPARHPRHHMAIRHCQAARDRRVRAFSCSSTICQRLCHCSSTVRSVLDLASTGPTGHRERLPFLRPDRRCACFGLPGSILTQRSVWLRSAIRRLALLVLAFRTAARHHRICARQEYGSCDQCPLDATCHQLEHRSHDRPCGCDVLVCHPAS